MHGRPNEQHDNWLLIKAKDDEARDQRDKDILDEKSRSVVNGRTIEEIAGGKGRKRVWHSNRDSGSKDTGDEKAAGSQSQRSFREELRAQAQLQAAAKSRGKPRAETKTSRGGRAKSKAKPAATAVAQKKSAAPRAGGKRAKLPDFVPPSLATLRDTPPSGAELAP